MPGVQKVCVICKEDCSARPRVRDERGRYACRACLKANSEAKSKAKQPAAAPAAVSVAASGNDDLLDQGFDDAGGGFSLESAYSGHEAPAAPTGAPCPACSAPVAEGSVVCLACGTNVQSGKKMATKVRKEPGVGMKAAGAVGTAVATPVLWTVGGLVGGLLGAALWAVIRGYLNFELGIVAWGVGLAAGAGVFIGNKGQGGVISGLFAAVVSLVCIALGKLGGAAIIASSFEDEISGFDPVAMEQSYIADEVVYEWEFEQDRELEWPSGMNAELAMQDYAYWPTGYPADVQAEALDRWNALSPAEQQRRLDEAEAFDAAIGTAAVFLADLSLFDVLWVGLAMVSAFKMGAGGFED